MRSYCTAILFATLLGVFACVNPSEKKRSVVAESDLNYRVERAPEWTAMFQRSSGWFGGDGIFAIPFSGNDNVADSVLFVFSDTMVGEIKDSTLQPGYHMVNNSILILKGKEPLNEKAAFRINRDGKNQPTALFKPTTPKTKTGEYYWLGDGFVNQAKESNLYIFAYRIRNTNTKEAFPFREVGNALLVIPRSSSYPFKDHRQLDLPFYTSSEEDSAYTSLGVGILANTAAAGARDSDEYVYVYGIRGKAKELIAARVKPAAFEDFAGWEFWNGKSWETQVRNAAPIADSVSNELSVTPIGNNQYALIYQYGGIFPTICMQTGPTPVGPFGPRRKIWDTTSDIKGENLFTYNAKAHPALSGPGELLVSYNVNSFEFFEEIKHNPNLYRPRFIRIVFDKE